MPSEAVHWEGDCHIVFVRDKNFLQPGRPQGLPCPHRSARRDKRRQHRDHRRPAAGRSGRHEEQRRPAGGAAQEQPGAG